MTDEEKSKELTRSSFAAQMAMLGYEPDGNPKDMVEVVRCKDCKYWLPMNRFDPDYHPDRGECEWNCWVRDFDWFCADGKRRNSNAR